MMGVTTFSFALVLLTTAYGESDKDRASLQIVKFKETHPDPIGILTGSNGAPIEHESLNSLNSNLLLNEMFTEQILHLVNENIPERAVHGKGAGAFGKFKVTNDVTEYTKAHFLGELGKETPVAVRFSTSKTGKGGVDTNREFRGLSIKFYTEEGNFDFIGTNQPVFAIKDPVYSTSFVHFLKRNPVTNLPDDPNITWDFVTSKPEALNVFVRLLGDSGISDGYRHILGHSVHTFQMVNERGVNHFSRIYLMPKAGVKNLNSTQALALAASDPEYATKDLYNAIDKGDHPCWTMYLQPMTEEDVRMAEFDVFDVTMELSEEKYPWVEVGEMCLNKNPDNYFADVEQLAFWPCNLVPGIKPAPDKIFEARCLAYKAAHISRLGINSHNIPVNYPKCSKILNFDRDGAAPVLSNGGGSPNYYTKIFNGPVPYVDANKVKLYSYKAGPSNNTYQTSEYFENLTESEKNRTVSNMVLSLREAIEYIQNKALDEITKINPDLACRIAAGLKAASN